MSPDEFQEAWQAESANTRVTLDPELLLKAVQQNQQEMRTAVSWNDFSELGIWVLLLPVWIGLGLWTASPWTWYLMVPAMLWGAGLKLGVRTRLKKTPYNPNEPLLAVVVESLVLVEHQIWSRRNAFWWTELPMAVAIMVFFIHVSWQEPTSWVEGLVSSMFLCAFVVAIYGSTHYRGRRVVRRQLEPQRRELLALLESLGDETADGVPGEYPMLMGGNLSVSTYRQLSPRGLLAAGICFLVLLSIGIGGAYLAQRLDGDAFSKASPFTAVRWNKSQPEVEVDATWFALQSLDGLSADAMVAFSQETFGARWQKRFEEDLVELLTRMGHPPGDTVTLVVQSLESSETRTLEDVPMTRANREAIRDAAQARERARGPEAATHEERSNVDTSEPDTLTRALEEIRAAYGFPAMAAFTLQGGVIVEQATVGTRSSKDDTPVGSKPRWHLGSNTKAMTATVAGMLVEEGLLQWDSTVGDVLGGAAPDMDPGHRDTTLAMLLHHMSGIAANIDWFSAPEDRVACAAQILSRAPGKRGRYAYSNAGYVVAGAMMEVVTGERWEALMQTRLFDPLGMAHTGFGAPSDPGDPWGHQSGWLRWKPMDPADRVSDNAPVLGPAGTVHATLDDYARFIAAHLAGARGTGGIVSAETFATLHTPPEGGDYAIGWSIAERDWAGGRTLAHSGSNTLWYATVWIAPEKDMAFFAATNVGGSKAFEGVDEAIGLLIGRSAISVAADTAGD